MKREDSGNATSLKFENRTQPHAYSKAPQYLDCI